MRRSRAVVQDVLAGGEPVYGLPADLEPLVGPVTGGTLTSAA